MAPPAPELDSTPDVPDIADHDLMHVIGGASRVSSLDQTMLLTQITSSIKDLAANKKQIDPTMMMMMMMMMGGGGGGRGGAPVAMPEPSVPPPTHPVVTVDTTVSH